ncbi:MAG: hypothetical protein IKB51_02950 [Clostridia bacterium]|nr:hypothetical protein [Clostridia bacterium]
MSDMSIKDRLVGMSDIELYRLINSACAAAGVDRRKAEQLTSDIPRLRRMIAALSDRQISDLLASLGSRDINDTLRQIGGGK